jgi:hypothetical protein
LIWALILSILLHFLIIFTCLRWDASFFQESSSIKQTEPLVFEIIQEDLKPVTVIETGEESEEAPEHADFLSDKQSVARNEKSIKEKGRMPYSEGQVEMGSIHPLPGFSGSWQIENRPAENRRNATDDGIPVIDKQEFPLQSFSRDRLLGISRPNSSDQFSGLSYKELHSSVERLGGLSFNTYSWEYAPYLLKLKERIQKNIFPPASFTRLGFGGSHLIRFRIQRNGILSAVTLLGYDGDKGLTETSMNSLQVSSPFWPLPEDFPEPYLEVTALFRYFGKESYE